MAALMLDSRAQSDTYCDVAFLIASSTGSTPYLCELVRRTRWTLQGRGSEFCLLSCFLLMVCFAYV